MKSDGEQWHSLIVDLIGDLGNPFGTCSGVGLWIYDVLFVFCKFLIKKMSNVTNTNYLQHFYKMLMWPTSYWFSSRPIINITFSFTNNHSPYQQFVNFFCKIICITSIILKKRRHITVPLATWMFKATVVNKMTNNTYLFKLEGLKVLI